MPAPTEHIARTPCEWCGVAIRQPPTGRRLLYCSRAHRQRAYEVRTAQARLERDQAAGVVRPEPAERVVERIVQRRHPGSVSGWERALEELAAQLVDGRITAWDRDRIVRSVDAVRATLSELRTTAAAPAPVSGLPVQRSVALTTRRPAPAVPPPVFEGAVEPPASALSRERTVQLVDRLTATSAGSGQPTTLQRIARELGSDVDSLRVVLAELASVGAAQLWRPGPRSDAPDALVDPIQVADHARITFTLIG